MIRNVSAADAGTYRCTGTTDRGVTDTDLIDLHVEYPPVVEVTQVEPGVECRVEGWPTPTGEWRRQGVRLETREVRDGSGVARYRLVADEMGRYECWAENK